ncbi:MAG: DEAD/DEAH box helicase [Candidatus Levyibacteriota bacterium]
MFSTRFKPHKNFRSKAKQKVLANHELYQAIRTVEIIKKGKAVSDEEQCSTSTFNFFDLSTEVLQNVFFKGYKIPTPIQEQTIPAVLSGRDVIGIANTGTGKTAAFLIPLIDKVFRNKSEKVLIVAPTRELAMQIHDELKSFSKSLGIHSILLIGGMSVTRQKGELKSNPHFIIGTPGRIKDLIVQKSLFLSIFHNVVLDEADRMVEIGFIADIKYFISLLPLKRQSLFFSATISGKEKEILNQFVHNPITASVKQQDMIENIGQDVIKLENGQRKIDKLHDLLAQEGFDKVLVFGRTKWGIQKLTIELTKRGFKVAAIHGNKNQNQRQKALQQFKNNEVQMLLATDVASRGLDIEDVTHVINYDMPASLDDYIHRIGRTGRAGKKGIALTFME